MDHKQPKYDHVPVPCLGGGPREQELESCTTWTLTFLRYLGQTLPGGTSGGLQRKLKG